MGVDVGFRAPGAISIVIATCRVPETSVRTFTTTCGLVARKVPAGDGVSPRMNHSS
jgi:hypothetical protein